MKNNILVSINNLNDIEVYKKVGINTFLFALSDYSVGYPNTFSIDEINNYSDAYVLINALLDTKMVESLRGLLPKIKVKGIVYEDIAILNMVKEMNLDLELIMFQNHFGTNINSINSWLKFNDSVFVSNELTYEELVDITSGSDKSLVVHLLGFNQVMYSRRMLLSNYCDNYNLSSKKESILSEEVTDYKFRVIENDLGTVIYDDHVFYDKRILDLEVKYYYVNSSYLSIEEVINLLNRDSLYSGFLDKKTVFKISEVKK